MNQVTAAIKLLGLTALAGEFPSAALSRLVGKGRYKEKLITDLKTKKLIKVYNRDGVRAYRLMLGGKKLLLENSIRYGPILEIPVQSRRDLPHRIRQHQMCEVLLSMQKAGIAIFPDEKTALFCQLPTTDETQSGIMLPAYYTSLEIKAIGPDGTKIKNARFCGVMLAENHIFIVYNAGSAQMRWDQKSEIKTRALVSFLFCRQWFPKLYSQSEVRGILIGADMSTAQQLLCETHSKAARLFRFDQTFEHFHFIPNTLQGDFLLQLLCNAAQLATLQSVLSEGLLPADSGAPIENDGFEEDGTPVLFAFDGDLQRLQNFINMLQLRESSGSVICFDFQAEAFCAYCGDNAKLQTIDMEKLKRRIFPS